MEKKKKKSGTVIYAVPFKAIYFIKVKKNQIQWTMQKVKSSNKDR